MKKQKVDLKLYDNYINLGLVNKKISNCGNYILFNYTDKCVFEKTWDDLTLNARGAVYEIKTNEVIVCTFPKFFNFSELESEKQESILRARKFEVFTKEDGSMGAVAFYNGKWNVTTRGSFESEQAVKATQMLSNYNISKLNKAFTYIVEIIYPENRIIVNYGSEEKLVLLACIETKTGREADLEALKGHAPFPIAESHSFKSIDAVIEAVSQMDANSEGFVVKLRSGERFKVKSPEYLKLARIMSRMSPLVLWENMKDGKVSTELMQSIPEEFRADYEAMRQELESYYDAILMIVNMHTDDVITAINGYIPSVRNLMKDIGLYLKDNPNEFNQFVFPIVNKKFDNVDKMIMREIRPTGNIL